MEERGLRVSGNRVSKTTFGPKRGEVKEEWRRLHNEELHDLYSSPFEYVIRVNKPRRIK
jgi:hypothetical protein